MLIAKTDLGHRVLKDRSVALTPRQRAAFILVDGKRTRDELLAATKPVGVTNEDVDRLLELGLVEAVTANPGPVGDVTGQTGIEPGHRARRTPAERFANAYPIATALTAELGLRGFRLNLAVEAASSYEDLVAVASRIKDVVGPEKFAPLQRALDDS